MSKQVVIKIVTTCFGYEFLDVPLKWLDKQARRAAFERIYRWGIYPLPYNPERNPLTKNMFTAINAHHLILKILEVDKIGGVTSELLTILGNTVVSDFEVPGTINKYKWPHHVKLLQQNGWDCSEWVCHLLTNYALKMRVIVRSPDTNIKDVEALLIEVNPYSTKL